MIEDWNRDRTSETSRPEEHLGSWWLPANEEQAVAGILSLSRNRGISLDLIGVLAERAWTSEVEHRPIILGLTREGKEITLAGCTEIRYSLPLTGGIPHQQWRVTTAYFGAHFGTEAQTEFKGASMQFTYLADFVGKSGVKWRRPSSGEEESITFEPPPAITAHTSIGAFSILFSASQHMSRFSAAFTQRVYIKLDAEHAMPLEEWESVVTRPLQNLLTLATGTPNALVGLDVYSPHAIYVTQNQDEIEIPVMVRQHLLYQEDRALGHLTPTRLLFALDDIEGSLASFLTTWLAVSRRFRVTCDSFFSVQYVPFMYAEHRYLNMLFACEVFHRQIHGTKMDLKQRLGGLLDEHWAVMEPLVGWRRWFVRAVAATRDDLVHGDPKVWSSAKSGRALGWFTERLAFLVRACLMSELGFQRERILGLFQRNEHYQDLVQGSVV